MFFTIDPILNIVNINAQTRSINMQIVKLIPQNVCLSAKSRNVSTIQYNIIHTVHLHMLAQLSSTMIL